MQKSLNLETLPEVGQALCDLHYPLPKFTLEGHPLKQKAIEIPADVAWKLLPNNYINKMLVVVGTDNEQIAAAYCRDGLRAGIITLSF